MKIRKLESEELGSLLSLYRDLHHSEEPSSVNEAEKSWNEIQSNDRILYFGVFVENALVSSCSLAIMPNLTRGGRPYGLIENVVTSKDHRRKGLGKALLCHALDYAWKKECYKVMLMTGRLDEETFAFYESAGFDRHTKQAFIAKPEN
jgi:GNAT superfamily N-acetyltransferase